MAGSLTTRKVKGKKILKKSITALVAIIILMIAIIMVMIAVSKTAPPTKPQSYQPKTCHDIIFVKLTTNNLPKITHNIICEGQYFYWPSQPPYAIYISNKIKFTNNPQVVCEAAYGTNVTCPDLNPGTYYYIPLPTESPTPSPN